MTQNVPNWLQELRAHVKGAAEPLTVTKDYLGMLLDEIEDLRFKVGKAEICRCVHRRDQHVYDTAIREVFCQQCPVPEDVHDFEVFFCSHCQRRDLDCIC